MSRKNTALTSYHERSMSERTAVLEQTRSTLLTTDILSVNVLIILGLVLIITNAALNV
jgi:hypothetical protein